MPGKVPPANQFKHLPDLQRKTPDDPFSLFYFSLDWYPTLELKVGARTDWANAWTLPRMPLGFTLLPLYLVQFVTFGVYQL